MSKPSLVRCLAVTLFVLAGAGCWNRSAGATSGRRFASRTSPVPARNIVSEFRLRLYITRHPPQAQSGLDRHRCSPGKSLPASRGARTRDCRDVRSAACLGALPLSPCNRLISRAFLCSPAALFAPGSGGRERCPRAVKKCYTWPKILTGRCSGCAAGQCDPGAPYRSFAGGAVIGYPSRMRGKSTAPCR